MSIEYTLSLPHNYPYNLLPILTELGLGVTIKAAPPKNIYTIIDFKGQDYSRVPCIDLLRRINFFLSKIKEYKEMMSFVSQSKAQHNSGQTYFYTLIISILTKLVKTYEDEYSRRCRQILQSVTQS